MAWHVIPPQSGSAGRRRCLRVLALAIWLVRVAAPAAPPPLPGETAGLAHLRAVADWSATNARRQQADPNNILALPGLLADRARRRVELMAESTGVPEGTRVEFILVAADSQHGYEAIAVSHARPSDVHRALEFIGLPAGAACNPRALRMWPRGERVLIRLAPAGAQPLLRAEQYILDLETGRTLPESGFVFVGSSRQPTSAGTPAYGADSRGARPIVALYNEPLTVLDVPRLAAQGRVYDRQVINPGRRLPAGQLLTFILEPEYPDGRRRVRGLLLAARPAAGGRPVFDLHDADGRALAAGAQPDALQQALDAIAGRGQDACARVRFNHALRLDDATAAARALENLEGAGRLRVEPPEDGQLYFRAFLPDEQWRRRQWRALHPWELHLRADGGRLAGKLLLVESPLLPSNDPPFTITETPVSNAGELARRLAEEKGRETTPRRLPVLLVFADADLASGALADFIRPCLAEQYVIYVFLNAEPATTTTGDPP